VLGLPPAFVLSQDQTLKLNENLFWLVTVFEHISKLMRNLTSPKHTCLRASSKITMNLINVTAKSLPHVFVFANTWRKDLAVHVSLSSYSIVKQQDGVGFYPIKRNVLPPDR
jgi:hypothetical protein